MKKHRFIEITNKKIKIYDAETTPKEILSECLINFIYGFVGNLMVPFIVARHDFGIVITMGLYYFMLSYILNRDKYESKLGRYMLLPIPAIIGAYTAIKLGYVLTTIL